MWIMLKSFCNYFIRSNNANDHNNRLKLHKTEINIVHFEIFFYVCYLKFFTIKKTDVTLK